MTKPMPIVACLLAIAGAAAALAVDESPGPTHEAIRGWIAELDSDRFAGRQAATRELIGAGAAAVPLIREMAENADIEGVVRAVHILSRLANYGNGPAQSQAQDALVELAASTNPTAARWARLELVEQQSLAIARLQAVGARISEDPGEVTYISLSGSESVTDDDLALLRFFPDLVSLSLNSTRIGDAGMKHVKQLARLERLDLYRTQVGDNGLEQLKNMPRLTQLPVGETKVTDAGLAHIEHMTQLEYLGLRGNAVTDAGLVRLKRLTNLTGLYLGETQVTDAGLVHIRGLTRMRYLRLHTVNVTDAGLENLREMAALSQVDVYETGISDDGERLLKSWLPDCNVVRNK